MNTFFAPKPSASLSRKARIFKRCMQTADSAVGRQKRQSLVIEIVIEENKL